MPPENPSCQQFEWAWKGFSLTVSRLEIRQENACESQKKGTLTNTHFWPMELSEQMCIILSQ